MMNRQEHKPAKEYAIKVWDLPVRIFHWVLVASFITAWLTLDNQYLDIHIFAGYLIGSLASFRVIWGFMGGRYALFSSFFYNFTQIKSHIKSVLKRSPDHYLGHNPGGSVAIYLLLSLSIIMVISGLLAMGGEEQQGPLAGVLNYPQGKMAHNIHNVLAWIMLSVVSIHVLGVLLESLLSKENLVRAMISGNKISNQSAPSTKLHFKTAVMLIVAVILGGGYWFQGYFFEAEYPVYVPFSGPQLPDNALWREECGSCHLAFHPSLLPSRSWQLMIKQQSAHFNEDLYLEPEVQQEILQFLVQNSAENELTEPAYKINRSIAKSDTLLRISKTPYWIKKHKDIEKHNWQVESVRTEANCAACHLDADAGTFEDAAMRLPTK